MNSTVVRRICLLLPALAVVTIAAPRLTAGEIAFSFEYAVALVGWDPPEEVWAMEGSATAMGPVTGESRDFFTANARRIRGTSVIESANGDLMFHSYEVEQVEDNAWAGTFTIEGGTGRFEGATGGGTLFVASFAPGTAVGIREGTLCLRH
jgi:hypothetical protein